MDTKVDHYIGNSVRWHTELSNLRVIVLDSNLNEEYKWAAPVYSYKGKNIVGLGSFKNYCALAFFKGALLNDPEKMLSTPGKVQSGRLIKFTSVKEIVKIEPVLKAYIFEAIEVEKAGLRVKMKNASDFIVPKEFENKLDELPTLKKAFYSLTPGRQRGYLFYFSSAKQAATREARIEKYVQKIFDGKGLDD